MTTADAVLESDGTLTTVVGNHRTTTAASPHQSFTAPEAVMPLPNGYVRSAST